MTELDRTCWCTHTGHDHEAGGCWAQVIASDGTTGQCGCNWWDPPEPPGVRMTAREFVEAVERGAALRAAEGQQA